MLSPSNSSPADRRPAQRAARPPLAGMPAAHPSAPPGQAAFEAPPPGVLEVPLDGGTHALWPFTTAEFPARPQDPVNLVFVGRTDPREIRAALLSVDGERGGFSHPLGEGHPLFAARWRDAIGGMQAAYSGVEGWTGSAVQLECGEYGSFRAHIRIFAAGGITIANAHLDMLIPGTAEHEVISWELARELVVYDLARSGLLDPDTPTLCTAPLFPDRFRRVDPAILHAMGGLREALVAAGSIDDDGALRTGGGATVLRLTAAAPEPPAVAEQELVLRLDQVVPKPFCNEGAEHVRVQGSVTLRQRIARAHDASLTGITRATGDMWVTPVDPATRAAIGPASPASASDSMGTVVADGTTRAWMSQLRELHLPGRAEVERLEMEIGPGGRVRFKREEFREE